jgi:hypothetical protein
MPHASEASHFLSLLPLAGEGWMRVFFLFFTGLLANKHVEQTQEDPHPQNMLLLFSRKREDAYCSAASRWQLAPFRAT